MRSPEPSTRLYIFSWCRGSQTFSMITLTLTFILLISTKLAELVV